MREIDSWEELLKYETEFERLYEEWIFRGEASDYRLAPTLERAFDDFGVLPPMRYRVEDGLIRDFKRLCPSYDPPEPLPDDSDTLAWIALMRHYGAPSRFLDFSFSFFVAAYFALQAEKAKPVIWAINKTWLTRRYRAAVEQALPERAKQLFAKWGQRDSAVFKELFQVSDPNVNAIWPVNPYSFNRRLAAQQGLFLVANAIDRPFHEQLEGIGGVEPYVRAVHIVGAETRRRILIKLHRTLTSSPNIFPGFHGFAESMRPKILIVHMLEQMKDAGARLGPNITDGLAPGV